MIIKELHLKSFGKFTDTRLRFQDGVSVIYGENEYGKSTIYAFIKAMLFGLERGRGRAAGKSEFNRYEPWENPGYYAGVMRFTCGGRNFRLERQFDKPSREAVLVCEDDGEELSVKDGDLDMLLGGMTSASFENAVAIGPLAAKPGQELAAELKNYAANYYETGSGEVDFYGAMEFLKERKKSVEQKLKAERETQENRIETLRIQGEMIQSEVKRLNQEWRELEKRQGGTASVPKNKLPRQKIGVGLCVLSILGGFIVWKLQLLAGLFALPAVLAGAGIFLLWKSLKEVSEETLQLQDQQNQLQWERERNRAEMKEKQIQLHNLREQAEEAALPGENRRRLQDRRRALELAMEKLQEAAAHMTQEFGERLNREISAILAQITNGKYTRVFVDEQLQMSVYCDGRRISVERLSRGTIEQVYFALRMAALDLLYEESVPVIFDDAFICYDEKRLKSTLKWLSEQPRQVIIFSCQRREKEIIKQF